MAQGTMDAISLLEQDHQKVKQLFGQIQGGMQGGAGGQPHQFFQQIYQELQVHTKVEEEIFYPAVRSVDQHLIDEAIQEHDKVDQLLSQLHGMQPTDGQFASSMRELIQNVEHHVQEEETELFPKVRQSMGGQLQDLGQRMMRRKQELMGQMAA